MAQFGDRLVDDLKLFRWKVAFSLDKKKEQFDPKNMRMTVWMGERVSSGVNACVVVVVVVVV